MKKFTFPLIIILILASGCQTASGPAAMQGATATIAPSATPAPSLPFSDLEPYWSEWVKTNAPGPLVVYCKLAGGNVEAGVHVEAGQAISFDSSGNPVPPTVDGGLVTFQTDQCTFEWVNGIKIQASPSLTLKVSAGKGLVYQAGSGQVSLANGTTLDFGTGVAFVQPVSPATAQPVSPATVQPVPTPTMQPTSTTYFPGLPAVTPVPLETISPANAGQLTTLNTIRVSAGYMVYQMVLSPDHAYLSLLLQDSLGSYSDKIVQVLNSATGELVSQAGAAPATALNPDGLHFTSYDNGSVRVFESLGGKMISEHAVSTAISPEGLTFSPDRTYLAIQTGGNRLEIWDILQGVKTSQFDYPGQLKYALFSQDNQSIALNNVDQLNVYDTHSGNQTLSIPISIENNPFYFWEFAISPDGTRVAVVGVWKSAAESDSALELKLWEAPSGKQIVDWQSTTENFAFADLLFSPDGKWLAFDNSFEKDQTTTPTNTFLFNALNGKISQTLDGQSGLAFSLNGRYFSVMDLDAVVVIYNLQNQSVLAKLSGHTSQNGLVVFSQDGTCLASSADDQTVRVWGIKAGGSN